MVVLVTGGSQGIGAEICRQLAGRGATVYAASRRGTSPFDGVKAIVLLGKILPTRLLLWIVGLIY